MMNKTFTLKELKELDAKATSAPWVFSYGGQSIYSQKKKICGMPSKDINYFGDMTNLQNSKLIAATRNALPELIRVIELVEDELNHVDKIIKELKNDKYGRFRPTKAQGEAIWFSVSQALAEIRKLKGE